MTKQAIQTIQDIHDHFLQKVENTLRENIGLYVKINVWNNNKDQYNQTIENLTKIIEKIAISNKRINRKQIANRICHPILTYLQDCNNLTDKLYLHFKNNSIESLELRLMSKMDGFNNLIIELTLKTTDLISEYRKQCGGRKIENI